MLHQKFLGCVDSFILMSTVRVIILGKPLCNLQWQEHIDRHVGNFHTVFVYEQIPNFMNRKPSVTFENCEHHMSHFISRSLVLSTTSFIVVNVFSLLVESVYPQMYSVFKRHICCHLCVANTGRFSAMRKWTTVCTLNSPNKHLRAGSKITSQQNVKYSTSSYKTLYTQWYNTRQHVLLISVRQCYYI